jgi:hypothetical protein
VMLDDIPAYIGITASGRDVDAAQIPAIPF